MNLTGVTVLEIGGEKRPLRFGTFQTHLYCKEKDVSITGYMKDMQRIQTVEGDGSELVTLIWSALKAGAMSDGSEFDFNPFPEVSDWIDEVPTEDMLKVLGVSADTQKRPVPKRPQKDTKKTGKGKKK